MVIFPFSHLCKRWSVLLTQQSYVALSPGSFTSNDSDVDPVEVIAMARQSRLNVYTYSTSCRVICMWVKIYVLMYNVYIMSCQLVKSVYVVCKYTISMYHTYILLLDGVPDFV